MPPHRPPVLTAVQSRVRTGPFLTLDCTAARVVAATGARWPQLRERRASTTACSRSPSLGDVDAPAEVVATVECHLTRVMTRLGTRDRPQTLACGPTGRDCWPDEPR